MPEDQNPPQPAQTEQNLPPPDTAALRRAAGIGPKDTLWVFGYGSLIWLPCFTYSQALAAHLTGWHRDFCLYSTKYRGTPEKPGLVLGLDHGGHCQGVAFEIEPQHVEEALAHLWQREMGVEDFYTPMSVPVRIIGQDDMTVNALTFVVRENNPVHCPNLPRDKAAEIIAFASGMTGTNAEYLEKTVMGLQGIGVEDANMEDLLLRVRTWKLTHKSARAGA